jgi:hypothetical protein
MTAAAMIDPQRLVTDHYGETTPESGRAHEDVAECASCFENHQQWLEDTNDDPNHNCHICDNWLGELN